MHKGYSECHHCCCPHKNHQILRSMHISQLLMLSRCQKWWKGDKPLVLSSGWEPQTCDKLCFFISHASRPHPVIPCEVLLWMFELNCVILVQVLKSLCVFFMQCSQGMCSGQLQFSLHANYMMNCTKIKNILERPILMDLHDFLTHFIIA